MGRSAKIAKLFARASYPFEVSKLNSDQLGSGALVVKYGTFAQLQSAPRSSPLPATGIITFTTSSLKASIPAISCDLTLSSLGVAAEDDAEEVEKAKEEKAAEEAEEEEEEAKGEDIPRRPCIQ